MVHEAYVRLVDAQHWTGHGHFFAAAAEAMRRILVDNARRKRWPKHGGDRGRVDLDEAIAVADDREDVLALDEALVRLAEEEPVKAELVKLRYYAGLQLILVGRQQEVNWRCGVNCPEPFLIDRANPGLMARDGDAAGPPRTVGLLKCIRLVNKNAGAHIVFGLLVFLFILPAPIGIAFFISGF